jgi:hypothetical protein
MCTSDPIRAYGAFVRHHFCSMPYNEAIVLNYTMLIFAVSFVFCFSMSYSHDLVFAYLCLFVIFMLHKVKSIYLHDHFGSQLKQI